MTVEHSGRGYAKERDRLTCRLCGCLPWQSTQPMATTHVDSRCTSLPETFRSHSVMCYITVCQPCLLRVQQEFVTVSAGRQGGNGVVRLVPIPALLRRRQAEVAQARASLVAALAKDAP